MNVPIENFCSDFAKSGDRLKQEIMKIDNFSENLKFLSTNFIFSDCYLSDF